MVVLWIVLAVLVVAALVIGLVATRSRRGPRFDAPPRPGVDYPAPEEQSGAAVGTLEPAAPEAPGEAPAEAPIDDLLAAPSIETPAPTAGRLLRLRARLARSQTTLGRGLLSVLSREKLDEQAWEEVEEALLAADVGVRPTTEIVERTAYPHQGARDPLAG